MSLFERGQLNKMKCRENGDCGGESNFHDSSAVSRLDLMRIRGRLQIISLILIVVLAFSLVVSFFQYEVLGFPKTLPIFLARIRAVLILLLSVATYFVTASRWLTARSIETLGLVYQVSCALVMAVTLHAFAPVFTQEMVGTTWLGVWILMFPLFAPTSIRGNLVAALLCASAPPVTYGIWIALSGQELASPLVLMSTFFPNFLCVGLAVAPLILFERLQNTLNSAMSEARDLGTYSLAEKLGEGGMGEVWRAEHRLLSRPAAIKLIRPDSLSDPAERQIVLDRFEREANATGLLQSPHTVELYDFGVTDAGALYYVMELLDGIDLRDLVEQYGPLPASRVVYILEQACRSLAEAHQRGIIHRDIKPANMLICRVGLEYDFLKILDFGLAAVTRTEKKRDNRLTQKGYLVGTPTFMAPERISDEKLADGRSDLYALGCVAYWLLTGTLVFDHETTMGLLMKHLNEAPELPTTRIDMEISPEFETLIMDLLAKSPADRPYDAKALSVRLRALPEYGWSQEEAEAWWNDHIPANAHSRANISVTAKSISKRATVTVAVPGPVIG